METVVPELSSTRYAFSLITSMFGIHVRVLTHMTLNDDVIHVHPCS